MISRRLLRLATLVVLLAVSGCVRTGVASAVRLDSKAAALATCRPPAFVTAADVPNDPSNFVSVGTVSIRYRLGLPPGELRKLVVDSVTPYACKWGGTHVWSPSLDASEEAPNAQHKSLIPTAWAEVVTVYRKPTEADLATRLQQMGVDDSALVKQVSFDTGCAAAQIAVVRKLENLGSGSYVVRACDEELKYSRQGTVFQKID